MDIKEEAVSLRYRRASAPTTGCIMYRSHQSFVENLSFPTAFTAQTLSHTTLEF